MKMGLEASSVGISKFGTSKAMGEPQKEKYIHIFKHKYIIYLLLKLSIHFSKLLKTSNLVLSLT